MAPTLAELDTRSRRWPWPIRLCYLTVKWALVALGAGALTFHFVKTWGWMATLWFLLFPLAYGIYLGWPSGSNSEPPTSTPARQ